MKDPSILSNERWRILKQQHFRGSRARSEGRVLTAPLASHPWEADIMVLIRKCPNVYTDIVEGARLPKIPVEVQDLILHENWKAVFPQWT